MTDGKSQGNPTTAKELEASLDQTVDVKVPASKRVNLLAVAGILASSFFFMLFFVGISKFWGMILGYIEVAFSLFGWDPMITALFMSIVFLFLGVVLYIASKRGSEAVSKMEAGFKIMFNNPPTRFYDLSEVPTANIVRELVGKNSSSSLEKGRGCKLIPHDEDDGFDIRCETVPMTEGMSALKEGRLDSIDLKQKIGVSAFFIIWGSLLAMVTFFGGLSGLFLYIMWGLFFFAFILVTLQLSILKVWGVMIAWFGMNVLLCFIVPYIYFLWTIWGAWICGLVIVILFYIVFKDSCIRKEAWYCQFM